VQRVMHEPGMQQVQREMHEPGMQQVQGQVQREMQEDQQKRVGVRPLSPLDPQLPANLQHRLPPQLRYR